MNGTDGRKPKSCTRKGSYLSVTSSTTRPLWTDLETYLDLCGKKPATNRLSHGTNLLSGFLESVKCKQLFSMRLLFPSYSDTMSNLLSSNVH